MAQTETKTKRIKHCYNTGEIYHRWIHSPNYVYNNSRTLSGKHNCLRLFDIGKDTTDIDLKEYYYRFKYRILAVIDRENKKIIISHKYQTYVSNIILATPYDYTIYHCKEEIPTYDILDKNHKEELCKLHLECCIEYYTNNYLYEYYASAGSKLTLHSDIDKEIDTSYYNRYEFYRLDKIIKFVKDYKVKHYSWYNKCLNDKFKLYTKHPYNWSFTTIKLPTVKQVVTDTVFTKKYKEYFRKRYFYTKYCYGYGVSFKDVEKYWKKPITKEEAEKYFDSRKLYWLNDWYKDDITLWNDCIITYKHITDNIHKKFIEKQKANSIANYKREVEKVEKVINCNNIVDIWRNNTSYNKLKVTYDRYISPNHGRGNGRWVRVTEPIYTKLVFDNVQLKLKDELVVTSRGASVTINDAIKGFKLLQKCIRERSNYGNIIFDFNGKHIQLGIYTLNSIKYRRKEKDDGTLLDYDSWCVTIGCHRIWLEEIEEFIKYYNLEDKFGLISNTTETQEKKNN